jgi:predicted transposase/invertase (TIGR01784 family)
LPLAATSNATCHQPVSPLSNMSRYLNPKNDLAFKTVFGGHKNLCISLLNALLRLEDSRRIKKIDYLENEQLPRIDGGRNSVVDVRCTDGQKRQFIVEMQMYWTTSFQQRVLLNASKAYVAQLGEGEDFSSLKPVYVLSFVNAIYDRSTETGGEYYHRYTLAHDGHPARKIEGIELVFVELPKFKPQRRAEKKFEQLWLLFLTAINERTRTPPKELLDTRETKQALDYVERVAFTPEQLLAYDKYWDAIRTERSALSDKFSEGEAKGLAKGKAEGLAEGKAEGKAEGLTEGETRGKMEVARTLKKMGLAVADIAKATGLTPSKIEKL